jgi:hypothetical protein
MSSLNPIRDILEFGGDGFELRSSFARFRLKIVVAFKCSKNGKLYIQVKLTKQMIGTYRSAIVGVGARSGDGVCAGGRSGSLSESELSVSKLIEGLLESLDIF